MEKFITLRYVCASTSHEVTHIHTYASACVNFLPYHMTFVRWHDWPYHNTWPTCVFQTSQV